MTREEWRERLKQACESAGTYREPFNVTLETLAEILEQRDLVMQQYREEGSHATIEAITDRGSRNVKENPLLRTWKDLNQTALAYLRELGLSPKALKVEPAKPERRSTLMETIQRLNAELGTDVPDGTDK